MSEAAARADIGIIGGTGLYACLSRLAQGRRDTPFGSASAEAAIGDVAGRRVAFLPRHGERISFRRTG